MQEIINVPKRMPVNFHFQDKDTIRKFYFWLQEAGGAISIQDLRRKFKERFGFWDEDDEGGFVTNSDGLITDLKYRTT